MQGIAEQIRELVRSVTNLARRIRRLETLQAPLAVARPQGGHIIQDEGIDLTERVYLNFVGVRVKAVDDPENGSTIITVSDPEGDDFCRVTPLDVGWQINAGTESRYMKHSTAFQLGAGGNTRGTYAVDLQQVRWGFDPLPDVAAGDFSAILGGEENRIHPNSDYCFLIGSFNWADTLGGWEPYECHVLGDSSYLYGDCFGLSILGQAHDIKHAIYGTYAGYNQQVETAFGCFSLIEGGDIIENVNEYPVYSGSIGILNLIEGDVFNSYQFGEINTMIGLGAGGYDQVWMCLQVGFDNHIEEQGEHVWQFGQRTSSYLPAGLAGEFFNGRFIASGDSPNSYPNGVEFSGFNQNSWFNQNTSIGTWTVAWISSRFQFPIIEDSIWGFTARILGTELGCANTYDWRIRGMVENDGGTTTIKWSIVDNYYRDVATKEWQVIADDANDRLVFQFRDTNGPDATICNIQFSMDTVEVGYD